MFLCSGSLNLIGNELLKPPQIAVAYDVAGQHAPRGVRSGTAPGRAGTRARQRRLEALYRAATDAQISGDPEHAAAAREICSNLT